MLAGSADEPLQVACAVEGAAYLRHCATMLHSLLVSQSRRPVQIHLLHGPDTSERGRQRLVAMVRELGGEITLHPVAPELLDGLPVKGFTGRASWYRVYLPDLLPDLSRIVYLDADLVVEESLDPLLAHDLEGCVVGAVTNVPQQEDRGRARRLGLAGDRDYFNAGVMVIDLDAMRAERISEEILHWARANGDRFGWRDQDALNIVLHARRHPLHPRWNCMNSIVCFEWASELLGETETEEARRRPAIRHFEGPAYAKPWHVLSPAPWRELYLTHRRRTPWPRVRPVGCTPGNLARRALRRQAL